MIIPEIDIITFSLFLIGSQSDKFDRHHRAGFNTGLFAGGAAFFAPVRGVEAQVAFRGFAFDVIPDGPVGLLRAHLDTGPAGDALFAVDSSDVAVFGIDVSCADWAILNADRRHTLSAGSHLDVLGEFAE